MLACLRLQLGQFVASSPTLFPAEYVAEFQQTLDRAPPVPMAAIEATLRQELGQDLQQLFSYIDPVPIATASVVRDSAPWSLLPVHAAVHKVESAHCHVLTTLLMNAGASARCSAQVKSVRAPSCFGVQAQRTD